MLQLRNLRWYSLLHEWSCLNFWTLTTWKEQSLFFGPCLTIAFFWTLILWFVKSWQWCSFWVVLKSFNSSLKQTLWMEFMQQDSDSLPILLQNGKGWLYPLPGNMYKMGGWGFGHADWSCIYAPKHAGTRWQKVSHDYVLGPSQGLIPRQGTKFIPREKSTWPPTNTTVILAVSARTSVQVTMVNMILREAMDWGEERLS